MWALILRLTRQLRAVPGLDRMVFVGWDMTAALALGRAMDIHDWLIAEVLPEVEAVAMAGLNGRENDNG